MNRVVNRRAYGFTIIELMLAMAFVSMLMLAIAMMIIQMANIYNKGTTLRAVEQAGQAVTQDIKDTLAAAGPLDVGDGTTGGVNYRPQIQLGGQQDLPDGGRLCTGNYSYIWNTGRGLASPVNHYETSDTQIRLVKVRDVGALYCGDLSKPIKDEDATELLSAGDRELAVQSFKIVPVATDPTTSQALYKITLELGTNDQDSLTQNASVTTIDTTCRPPSDSLSQRDFCAVNKFEFTARTGNRGDNT